MGQGASGYRLRYLDEDPEHVLDIYRGRAYHARMGAKEASSPDIRAIFERLAASYDALADEAEKKRVQTAEPAAKPEPVETKDQAAPPDGAISNAMMERTLDQLRQMAS